MATIFYPAPAQSGQRSDSPVAASPVGMAFIPAGQTSVDVANSLVTTGSFVHITPIDIDRNVTCFRCVEWEGSFTVTVDSACASNFRFKFLVTN